MTFNFPRNKFTERGGIINQIEHIFSEVQEAHEAALTPDLQHTAVELMDIIASGETGLRILQEFHGVDLEAAKQAHDKKDRERGYYETENSLQSTGSEV